MARHTVTATERRSIRCWTRLRASVQRDPYSAIVLAIAALLRLVVGWDLAAHSPLSDLPISDARHYLTWADSIRAGAAPTDVFFMAPLFPYVLASWRWLVGEGLGAITLIQGLLGWWSLWGWGQLARTLVGRSGRRIVLTIGALYAAPVYYESKVLVTTLAVFLGTSMLLVLLAAQRRDRPLRWLGAGLLLGLLAAARPQALLFAPLAMGWILLSPGVRSQRWRRAALTGVGALIAIGPVTLHNLAAGDLVLIASNGGINFYFGNNPLAEGTFNAPSADFGSIETQADNARRLAEQALESPRPLSPSETSAYWRGRGFDFITGSPDEWLAVELKKLRAFLASFEYGVVYLFEAERALAPTLWLMPIPFGLVLALGLAGSFALLSDRRAWLLLLFSAAQLATMMLFFVYGRFRVAMLPGLLPLASGLALWTRMSRRRQVCAAALSVAVLVTSFAWSDPFQARQRANAECELASAWLAKDAPDRAADHFEHALTLLPDFTKALHGLGRAHEARGEHAAALEDLDAALAAGGQNDPWVWTHRGDSLAGLGREQDAEAAYRRALELDATVGPAFTGLIEYVFERNQEWQRAVSWGLQLVERSPNELDFRVGTAYACYRLGRPDLGRPHFEAARRLAPTDGRVRNLARVYTN